MPLKVHQFMCLDDNFGVLIHCSDTGATASIDVPEAAPVLAALKEKGWTLTDILVTHHHADHIQGIPEVLLAFPSAKITGPKKDAARIPGMHVQVAEGDELRIGRASARVIETPGHTSGHIVYHFAEDELLFAGDTLFALGCGRVMETPMHVMFASLMKLANLPEETRVYCGHEYTAANAKFALTVDGANALLVERAAEVETLRAAGKPTLPTTIGLELATNPFLRAEDAQIQAAIGMRGRDPSVVFAELRERKNRS